MFLYVYLFLVAGIFFIVLCKKDKKMLKKLPKCPTWDQLRKVVESKDLLYYINLWPEELREAVALALSVAHWSPEARKDYSNSGWSRELGHFDYCVDSCGLCQLYYNFDTSDQKKCNCPLVKVGQWCNKDTSIWWKVRDAIYFNKFHQQADKMFNKLVQLYTKEWEKL
jgi:hypothetical protein